LIKCPGCGSIASDREDVCGVCGASLAYVQSTSESLEQIEKKREAEERSHLQKLGHENARASRRDTLIGLFGGSVLLLLGGWLFSVGFEGAPFIRPTAWAILAGIVLLISGAVWIEETLGLFKGAPPPKPFVPHRL